MRPRDTLVALVIVVVWGLNFVALKWSVAEVPPFLLTGLRYLFAAIPAVFFVRRPAVSFRFLAFYGTVVGTLQFSLVFIAIKAGMPAGLASLVMQTQVFFTFALAVWLLGERPGPFQIGGAAIAFGGIGVIAFERLGGASLVPLLLTLVAAFAWGASNIITKKAGKIDLLALVIWGCLIPPIPVFILSLIFEGPNAVPDAIAALSLRGGLSVLFTAYLSTLFAYGLWATLLGKYPANSVAPFTLLVPIFGIGSSWLLLHESISSLEIAGCALVFLGLLVNVFGPRLLSARRRLDA
jgi:O-acetylserine/cysteine efflux transporter